MPGGRLVFKGGQVALSAKQKAKKAKKAKRPPSLDGPASLEDEPVLVQLDEEEVRPIQGTGRITSSGTAVHGHETSFMTELSNGDAIIVVHPATYKEETRIVRIVLSSLSIAISSPFPTDLISTTSFKYIKAPKVEESQEEKEQKAIDRKVEEEKIAFGTYASDQGSKFVYRVRKPGTYGGYEIFTENTDQNLSREQLLDMRSKKKADRHCA